MTPRTISAIIFAIIVAIEIVLFAAQPTPLRYVRNPNAVGGFSASYSTIDYEAQQNQSIKFIGVIAATILVGGLVTFSLPSKPLSDEGRKKVKRWAISISIFLAVWILGGVLLTFATVNQPELEKWNGVIAFGSGIIFSIIYYFESQKSEEETEES